MKKSDVKYLVGGLAILLAIFLILGFATSWFSNWKFSTWFNSWGKEQKQEEPTATSDDVFALDGDRVLSKGNEYRLPQTLLITADAVRGSSIIITAPQGETFNEQTEYDAVWFVNSESEFAKSNRAGDCVEVCAVYDEAGVIIPEKRELKLKAPFGEQIMIQVSSTGEHTYSLCKLDCLMRVVCGTAALGGTDATDEDNIEIPIEYSVGTVAPDDIVVNSCTLSLEVSFYEDVKSKLSFDIVNCGHMYKKTANTSLNGKYIVIVDEKPLSYSMFITDFDVMTNNEKQAIYEAWYETYIANYIHENNILIDYDIEILYQGISIARLVENDLPCGMFTGYLMYHETVG